MSQYVKIETRHLTGAALDWAVAVCEGWTPDRPQDGQLKMEMPLYPGRFRHIIVGDDGSVDKAYLYSPSKQWAHGGPLMEKYTVSVQPGYTGKFFNSMALAGRLAKVLMEGDTVLVSVCRAVVAANLGDVVDIPKELQWLKV